jgi:hypothetical protein
MNAERTTLQIADTILQQLGGRRFIMMTGAKNFIIRGADRSLQFNVGRNPKGITKVRIALDLSDTYTMTFYKIRGIDCAMVASIDGIYADQLCRAIERETGLATTL